MLSSAITASLQSLDKACKALLEAHRELAPLARALTADWKQRPRHPDSLQSHADTLLSRAINFHVTWLYIKGDKTLLQLDAEQPVRKPG